MGISGLPVLGPKFPKTKSAAIGGETIILSIDLFTRRLGVFFGYHLKHRCGIGNHFPKHRGE